MVLRINVKNSAVLCGWVIRNGCAGGGCQLVLVVLGETAV